MAYELLKKIAASKLPMTLSTHGEIEELRILRDAGYVKAEIPQDHGEATAPATVLAVTPLGHTAMRYFGSGGP